MEFQLASFQWDLKMIMQLQLFAIEHNLFDNDFRQIIMDKIGWRYRYYTFYTGEKQSAICGFPGRILAAPVAFSAGAVRWTIGMRIDVRNLSFSKRIELLFGNLKNTAIAAHPELAIIVLEDCPHSVIK